MLIFLKGKYASISMNGVIYTDSNVGMHIIVNTNNLNTLMSIVKCMKKVTNT